MVGVLSFTSRLFRSSAAADKPQVVCKPGHVTVRSKPLFGGDEASILDFFERVFCIREVESLAIDRERQVAEFRFDERRISVHLLLEKLAAAFRLPLNQRPTAVTRQLLRDGALTRYARLSRCGDHLSTWEVVHEIPGRLRIRHDRIRGEADLCKRLEHWLVALEGVHKAHASSLTGTVVVDFHPDPITRNAILHRADEVLDNPEVEPPMDDTPPTTKNALAASTLGLAVVGELAFPVLLPVTAGLLIYWNLKAIKYAAIQLRRREIGLPTLHTTILACTLGTGQFVAAALMNWMACYWRRQSFETLKSTRQRLLGSLQPEMRIVQQFREGIDIEIPAERLTIGDVVSIREGEIVPADGTIIDGYAVIDEGLLREGEGLAAKKAGDRVFASSTVLEGAIRIHVSRTGAETRAASIIRAVHCASIPTPGLVAATEHGEESANKVVTPTIAAAGVGLLVGDLLTAGAILRPDYSSGPSLASSLQTLEDIIECLDHGVLVRDPKALERLMNVDVILLDDHPAIRNAVESAAGVVRYLRLRFKVRIGIVSHDSEANIEAFAAHIEADFIHAGMTPRDKLELIQELQDKGRTVAYVGNGQTNPSLVAEADVGISIAGDLNLAADKAPIIILRTDPLAIARLWDIAQVHARELSSADDGVLIPNVVCILGAFLFGFTSLYSVVISNFGTWTVFRRQAGELRGFEEFYLNRRVRHLQITDAMHQSGVHPLGNALNGAATKSRTEAAS